MKVIQKYLNNPLRNFNYIIYSEETKDAIFIDPLDISQTLPIANSLQLTPKYLLNTHHHPDHIKDNQSYLKNTQATQLKLEHNEVFVLSEREKIICKDTPGHVMDHQCFFLYEDEALTAVITGDTVFNSGVGNTRNGGDVATLHDTIRDVFIPLEDHVTIYPSHDYFVTNLNFAKSLDPNNPDIDFYLEEYDKQVTLDQYMNTTIGEEKKFNPFFRVFEGSDTLENFKKIRKLRDNW